MVKVNFFVDVWPSLPYENLCAYTTPLNPKPKNCKRYKISVELPDPECQDAEFDGTAALVDDDEQG
jgi:hypothetical protein